jgi:hypothetical protein
VGRFDRPVGPLRLVVTFRPTDPALQLLDDPRLLQVRIVQELTGELLEATGDPLTDALRRSFETPRNPRT